MKISASIYSAKDRGLGELVKELDDHRVDFFHIDCNDDPAVFDDIAAIRELSHTPIDLHVISARPSKYYDLLIQHEIDYVSFQYETLEEELAIPEGVDSKLGLAIASPTESSVFAGFEDRFEFVLIMATTPGKSGGTFDKGTFKKIRRFRQMYPHARIHVDGGVNAEVCFILRNMGVDASVSGSYLLGSDRLGAALLDLKTHDIDSHFLVKDFMRERDEIPMLGPDRWSFPEILQSIEEWKLGFTLLVTVNGALHGMVTNADVRKGLLKHIDDLNRVDMRDVANLNPVTVPEEFTVTELLQYVKSQPFPISYLPVVNHENKVTGAISFTNLVKGEA